MLPEATQVFTKLGKLQSPEQIDDVDWQILEQFFVVLYSSTCNTRHVEEARRKLFTSGRPLQNIPPTAAALNQHVLRSALQAGMWYDCLRPQRPVKNPLPWGWLSSSDGIFLPFGRSFLTLLLAAESSPAASAKSPALVDVDVCPLIYHVLSYVLVLENVINEIIIDNIVLLFSSCFAYRNWLNFLGISCSRFS